VDASLYVKCATAKFPGRVDLEIVRPGPEIWRLLEDAAMAEGFSVFGQATGSWPALKALGVWVLYGHRRVVGSDYVTRPSLTAVVFPSASSSARPEPGRVVGVGTSARTGAACRRR
jgi:hypothetical protein